MRGTAATVLAAFALASQAVPVLADDDALVAEAQPYVECVTYAREVTGIQLRGNAATWWDQAEGRYARGHSPRVGSVMAFQPYGSMTRGHVAAVSQVIDSRTVLLRHANWSPIGGRRGQIEDNVEAVDVSPGNDWSQVRVWYAPIGKLGTTVWPVAGFIYGDRPGPPSPLIAAPELPKAISPSRAFLSAFADFAPLAAKGKSQKDKAPVDLLAHR